MKTVKTLSLFLTAILITFLFAGCASNSTTTTIGTTQPVETTAPADTNDSAGYEEGTSDTDNIVNTTAADKVILVVSFGTSFNQSRSLTIGGIETAIKNAYPDYQVRRAFTSQIIIDKLAERDKLNIDNVTKAMDRLVLDGVKEVVVQPTTVMNGYEYDDMVEEVMPYADKFESLKIGKHLLSDDTDYYEVAELLVQVTSQYRADDTAIVFMGHGTEHESGITYTRLQDVLTSKGYKDYIIGTVEHGVELDRVEEMLKELGVKKVVLRPLMVVAGDHANNDMAGDEEDSWKTVLTEAGYEVETIVEGLGQITGIQDIYIKHVKDAISSDNLSSEAPAAHAAGVSAYRIKSGTYSIKVDSDTSMFKIVDCKLTVEDDRMTAVMTLSGKGYGKVYMGTVGQAVTDPDNQHEYTVSNERHAFTVPVSALDTDIDCAGFGAKSEKWYDHVVVFESADIPEDAFIPCQINVEMVGGTGKASIQSPATIMRKTGADYAEVVWSSPNYTYMIVDGTKYLPVNTEGNSVFEIPIIMDKDMPVIACTTAMSEPKEIEYTLHFNSSTIK